MLMPTALAIVRLLHRGAHLQAPARAVQQRAARRTVIDGVSASTNRPLIGMSMACR